MSAFLIDRDDGQLRRLNSAIAAIEARSPAERLKMGVLLTALQNEKAELLRYAPQLAQRRRTASHIGGRA